MTNLTQDEVTEVDEFRPNYKRRCMSCEQVPTVDVVKDGKVLSHVDLCGPCTWGESAMLDPEKWNE